jgi:hypothetical protein
LKTLRTDVNWVTESLPSVGDLVNFQYSKLWWLWTFQQYSLRLTGIGKISKFSDSKNYNFVPIRVGRREYLLVIATRETAVCDLMQN